MDDKKGALKKLLKAAEIEYEKSPQEMADELCMSVEKYYKLKNGTRKLQFEDIDIISRTLGIPAVDLLEARGIEIVTKDNPKRYKQGCDVYLARISEDGEPLETVMIKGTPQEKGLAETIRKYMGDRPGEYSEELELIMHTARMKRSVNHMKALMRSIAEDMEKRKRDLEASKDNERRSDNENAERRDNAGQEDDGADK